MLEDISFQSSAFSVFVLAQAQPGYKQVKDHWNQQADEALFLV